MKRQILAIPAIAKRAGQSINEPGINEPENEPVIKRRAGMIRIKEIRE